MAMFGKPKERGDGETKVNTVVGEGTTLVGTIKVEGSILIHGDVEGTLTASESVIVGKSGHVRAGISSRETIVAGRVRGKIVAKDRVELQTGARLEGDVLAKSFMIEEGVFFQGNCSMGDDVHSEDLAPSQSTGTIGSTTGSRGNAPDLGLLGKR
jgi:cytoskeletal protein CcmA (bactofilin family)